MVSTYPSEKWWSESQLGWWNSNSQLPNCFWKVSQKIPWFQSPPTRYGLVYWSMSIFGFTIPWAVNPITLHGFWEVFNLRGGYTPNGFLMRGPPRNLSFFKVKQTNLVFFFGGISHVEKHSAWESAWLNVPNKKTVHILPISAAGRVNGGFLSPHF